MIAVGLFAVIIHLAWWLLVDEVVVNGRLYDGDSYVRLLRIIQLFDTGNWFDSTMPRANAPFGGSNHWTRILDMIIIAITLPLTPFLGFAKALFWAGALVSPILHILGAMAIVWASLPVIGVNAAYLAGLLIMAQFGILGYASIGHADHHLLIVLIIILGVGFLLRMLMDTKGHSHNAFNSGLLLAAGIWVSPEMMILLSIFLFGAGMPWLLGEADSSKKNLGIVRGLTIGLAFVVMIEYGPLNYFAVEYDRVSIIYLTLAIMLAVFWQIMSVDALHQSLSGVKFRLVSAAAAITIIIFVMWWLYPNIMMGPLGDADPELLYMFGKVTEFASISSFNHFLVYLGGAIFAMPWAVWRTLNSWHTPYRWAWFFIALALFTHVAMAVIWIRSSANAGIFIAIVLADLLRQSDISISSLVKGRWRIVILAPVIVLLTTGPLVIGTNGWLAKKASDRQKQNNDVPGTYCPLQKVTRLLNQPRWTDRSYTILTSPNFGPEILYRTPHKVLGTMHHRNSDGTGDTIRILGSTDEATSRRIIEKRKVDLILICVEWGRQGYIRGRDDKRIFLRRLLNGDLPDWLHKIDLADYLDGIFLLFQVKRP